MGLANRQGPTQRIALVALALVRRGPTQRIALVALARMLTYPQVWDPPNHRNESAKLKSGGACLFGSHVPLQSRERSDFDA